MWSFGIANVYSAICVMKSQKKLVLLRDGYSSRTKYDIRCYIRACVQFGRTNRSLIVRSISISTGKPREEIEVNITYFWKRSK